MKVVLSLLISLWTTMAVAVSTANTIDLSKHETKVTFTATAKPNFLSIEGTGGKATGTIEIDAKSVKANVQVDLNKFTTGVSRRDEHMKDKYLETSKYPTAVLTISNLLLENAPLTTVFSQKKLPFKGKLSVHGTESDIEGEMDIDSTAAEINVVARTKTTMAAHKIDRPKFMGLTVEEQVNIVAEIKIKK